MPVIVKVDRLLLLSTSADQPKCCFIIWEKYIFTFTWWTYTNQYFCFKQFFPSCLHTFTSTLNAITFATSDYQQHFMEELGRPLWWKLTIYRPRRAADPAPQRPEPTRRSGCCCCRPHPAGWTWSIRVLGWPRPRPSPPQGLANGTHRGSPQVHPERGEI